MPKPRTNAVRISQQVRRWQRAGSAALRPSARKTPLFLRSNIPISRVLQRAILTFTALLLMAAGLACAQEWVLMSAPIEKWSAIASSSDGTKLVAATSFGAIYVSTNSGFAWAKAGAPSNGWFWVASSPDANKLLAVSGDGKLYVSTNSGATWTSTPLPSAYLSFSTFIASSSDGKTLVVSARWVIYITIDSGVSWATSTPSNGCYYASVACSQMDPNY